MEAVRIRHPPAGRIPLAGVPLAPAGGSTHGGSSSSVFIPWGLLSSSEFHGGLWAPFLKLLSPRVPGCAPTTAKPQGCTQP